MTSPDYNSINATLLVGDIVVHTAGQVVIVAVKVPTIEEILAGILLD